MSHDVFISFSSVNSDVAEQICEALERSGKVKCWIAFRDIVPSANYAAQLVEAIESCKLLLLILSEDSNRSPQVSREIERAGSKGISILPLRIEDVVLSKSMEYFISSHHWLDAFGSDIENCFPALQAAVESSIQNKTAPQPPTATSKQNRPTHSSPRGLDPKMIFGAGLSLTLLVLAIYFFKPEQIVPEPVQQGTPAATPVTQIPETTLTLSSPQDALIKELAQRFTENDLSENTNSDDWTSSNPVTIAFLDISGVGVSDVERDFILNRSAEELQESGRYNIVEREIIDKLLEELNLSSSALADPATALKLGHILSANLIVTGNVSRQKEQWLASLRFIETATTSIKCSVSTLLDKRDAQQVASELSKTINSKLRTEYPLQARITSISGDTAAMNIGQRSGVAEGMVFELVQDNSLPVNIAAVTSVDQQQSYIALTNNTIVISEGMRLREQIKE